MRTSNGLIDQLKSEQKEISKDPTKPKRPRPERPAQPAAAQERKVPLRPDEQQIRGINQTRQEAKKNRKLTADDLNDPNFDPSQLRGGYQLFKGTAEDEAAYQAMMEARVNAKKRNEAQEAAQREAEIKNRPAGFKFDLCDQEFAQLVI